MPARGADARRLDAAALGRASGSPDRPVGDAGALGPRAGPHPPAPSPSLPFSAGKFVRESTPGVLPLLCMGGAGVGVRSLS